MTSREQKQSELEEVGGFKEGDFDGWSNGDIDYWHYAEFQGEDF